VHPGAADQRAGDVAKQLLVECTPAVLGDGFVIELGEFVIGVVTEAGAVPEDIGEKP